MYVERYPRAEERLSAATHTFGAFLSTIGLVLLINQADIVGGAGSLPAVIVYGAALVLLFLFSAVHHAALHPVLSISFSLWIIAGYICLSLGHTHPSAFSCHLGGNGLYWH